MNAVTHAHARIEVPADALRLVADLIKRLGGRMLKDGTDEEVFFDSPPMPEKERVGRMVRGIRLREGLTQKQLAEAIGVPQSHVSEWEKHKRRVPAAKAVELARVLNSEVENFQHQD